MFWRKGDRSPRLLELTGDVGLYRALNSPVAVLYKHSTRCGVSSLAIREVERFAAQRPDVPTFLIDVLRDRALSEEVAALLEVRHETPQVIVLRNGVRRWDTSHAGVTASALAEHAGPAADG